MKIVGAQAAAFQREILEKFDFLEKAVQRDDRGVKSTANVELEPTVEGTVSPPVAVEGNEAEAERNRSAGEVRNSVKQGNTGSRSSGGAWEPSRRSWLYTTNTPFKREAGRDNGTFQMKSTRLKPQRVFLLNKRYCIKISMKHQLSLVLGNH